MIHKRSCNKMCPNSHQEKDLSGIKSAFYLVIDGLTFATLAQAMTMTPKKTSQEGAKGDQ